MSQGDDLIATLRIARAKARASQLVVSAADRLLGQARQTLAEHWIEVRKAEAALAVFTGDEDFLP